ncbi:MAG: hypothetical protein NC331_10220 [Lachnospiraceae bacterium]|nr:hypothetical protein [Lachnospiraceae bacterium]MCM1239747.1 hypothetical protein [Lachnospiraceae bacterium]
MKKNILAGILSLAFVLLAACSSGDEEDAVSLEPHSMGNGVAGMLGTGKGADDAVNGAGGNLSSAGADDAAADGHSGSAMTGTNNGSGSAAGIGGDPSRESGAPGNGSEGAGARTAAAGLSDRNREIYLQAVNENNSDHNGYYALIYLDGDDVPELVFWDGYFEEYSIYTVRDGALFCMVDSLYTVEMTYFERCGVIASFSRWNGGGDEGGYGSSFEQVSKDRTLTNDDQAFLSYSYNATYNEKGEYTGTGVIDYFYMGQEIDEAAYQEKLKSLGIAEGEDRVCMEDGCSKEEMAALLSQ